METFNNFEKRTFDLDEIQLLVDELNLVIKITEKLDAFDLLQEYSNRKVYLPSDISFVNDVRLTLNCYTTLRRAIFRFKSLYGF